LANDAVVVNVARGPVVDEAAMFRALQSDAVACYASDVWWKYPKDYVEASKCFPWNCCDLAALQKQRSVLSAHRGGAMSLGSTEAKRFGGLVAAVNALRRTGSHAEFANTSPLGRVNLAHGY
jgi:lactate dehydrogenase-like 2-hydroxyacid dehydrogenase